MKILSISALVSLVLCLNMQGFVVQNTDSKIAQEALRKSEQPRLNNVEGQAPERGQAAPQADQFEERMRPMQQQGQGLDGHEQMPGRQQDMQVQVPQGEQRPSLLL